MHLSLERNTAKNNQEIPYFIRVELEPSTLDSSGVVHIPVFLQEVQETMLFMAEACGYRVHAEKLDHLPSQVGQLLQSITKGNRLPNYVFISRYARNVHCVYTLGDEVYVKISEGPAFQHIELAKVREYLGEYLRQTGLLGTPNKPDKLHVRGIHGKSLALIRPIFYLKKRLAPNETNFWAPVFLSDAGESIYTFAASAKREATVDSGREILALHQTVATALIGDRRLRDPYDLLIDRLFPKQLKQLKQLLTNRNETIKVNDRDIPIFEKDGIIMAIVKRPDENRYSLFLGKSIEALSDHLAQNLARRVPLDG